MGAVARRRPAQARVDACQALPVGCDRDVPWRRGAYGAAPVGRGHVDRDANAQWSRTILSNIGNDLQVVRVDAVHCERLPKLT